MEAARGPVLERTSRAPSRNRRPRVADVLLQRGDHAGRHAADGRVHARRVRRQKSLSAPSSVGPPQYRSALRSTPSSEPRSAAAEEVLLLLELDVLLRPLACAASSTTHAARSEDRRLVFRRASLGAITRAPNGSPACITASKRSSPREVSAARVADLAGPPGPRRDDDPVDGLGAEVVPQVGRRVADEGWSWTVDPGSTSAPRHSRMVTSIPFSDPRREQRCLESAAPTRGERRVRAPDRHDAAPCVASNVTPASPGPSSGRDASSVGRFEHRDLGY